jgi:hypothetical protein
MLWSKWQPILDGGHLSRHDHPRQHDPTWVYNTFLRGGTDASYLEVFARFV